MTDVRYGTGDGSKAEEGGNWFACVREKRAAPSAPRSGPPAATLSGGLQPGSLRVHDPCKETRHGSRLGFPDRRPPRGPAAPGNVARDLQVLPRQAEFAGGGVDFLPLARRRSSVIGLEGLLQQHQVGQDGGGEGKIGPGLL